MNGDLPQHHWSVRWAYTKWPMVVKVASVVLAVAGAIGTILGFSGQIGQAIQSRVTKIQTEAIAKNLDKQRDDKVDATLDQHGKAIEQIKTGVQEVQTHLNKQDVELVGTKGQLDRIEGAILTQGAPHVALPIPPPSLPSPSSTP